MPNELTQQGDSFDSTRLPQVNQPQQTRRRPAQQEDILIKAISNPASFMDELGLSDEQAKNLRCLVTGGGAALGVKYLGEAFGEPVAGALGALLGGYVSKKVIKRGGVKRKKNINLLDEETEERPGGII